jgi:hypothetical protein
MAIATGKPRQAPTDAAEPSDAEREATARRFVEGRTLRSGQYTESEGKEGARRAPLRSRYPGAAGP